MYRSNIQFLFLQFRTLYTRSPTKTIPSKTPLPPSIFPSRSTVLDDGSTFIVSSPVTSPREIDSSILTTPLPTYISISKETLSEIRNLRKSDPKQWTVSALAKKYNLTKLMILKWAPLHSTQRTIIDSKRQMSRHLFRKRLSEQRSIDYDHYNF